MCGIAGILEFEHGCRPSPEALQRMAVALAHRGPDEEGFYRTGPVGLAHRRLSIIDLSSGQQPMETADGKICVVFNGEIYNYPELKAEFEQKGFLFRTTSDTEVLLAAFALHGVQGFQKLNGMFACAFWDSQNEQLVLARDRLGKKPVFYCNTGKRFLFASELKSILAHGDIDRKIHLPSLHEYLTHMMIVGNDTILEGIKRLPPGHYLVIKNGQITCQPYWHFRFEPSRTVPSEEEALDRLDAILRRAVKSRLMSEVPLGAFLSGGIDSSTIVALMTQLSDRPVQTFTIGFEESDYSELEDARAVARHLGTDHKEIMVRPSAFEILPKLVWHLDEPFGDSSAIPTYYVCEAARRHVTVVLSGDGGDEVFAGYTRYQELAGYQKMQRLPAWLKACFLKPLTSLLPFTAPGWNYLYALGHLTGESIPYRLGIYPYIQEKLYTLDILKEVRRQDPFQKTEQILRQAKGLDPVSRYQYLDTLQYLPDDILVKVDRMSMANSLEVRSPLLDYTLVEYMSTLPVSFKLRDGISKYILRKYCRPMLPPAVLNKRKQGFAIPKNQWFQKEKREYARDFLLDRRSLQRGLFREKILRTILDQHASGKRDYSDWIWCLIILEQWMRLFIDRLGEKDILKDAEKEVRSKALAPAAGGHKGAI